MPLVTVDVVKSESKATGKVNKLDNGITYPEREWVTSVERKQSPLDEAIEELCYDLLAAYEGGWEINDGSSGRFELSSKTGELTWSHHENRMTVETTERSL
jgi:hypothetical protein